MNDKLIVFICVKFKSKNITKDQFNFISSHETSSIFLHLELIRFDIQVMHDFSFLHIILFDYLKIETKFLLDKCWLRKGMEPSCTFHLPIDALLLYSKNDIYEKRMK